MTVPWILIGLGVLLTAATAFFVAAEFSLVTLDRSTVEQAVAGGDERSARIFPSLRTLSTQLSGAQVGITVTTLLVGYLAQPSVAALLTGPAQAVGLSPSAAATLAVTASLVLATVFSMVLGELLPQYLAIAAPLPVAKVVAGPVRAFSTLASPLIRLLNGSANRVLRRFGIEPAEELSGARTPEELVALVRRSAAAGTLDTGTAVLVTRSLGLLTRTAADVMTPRVATHWLRREATAADVLAAARATGHSRFPVTGQDLDDVVGVVHLKRAIGVPLGRRAEVPAAAIMDEVQRVPETVRLEPLLAQLRQPGLQLAVVVDEYGGTAGVVTLEDVVEELVGEVADEHDRGRGEARRLRDGRWRLPGMWRPDQVRELCGVAIPDSGAYETIGGFVMSRLGRIPRAGDEVEVEDALLTVLRMDGRRADVLLLTPAREPGGRTLGAPR